MAKKLELFYKDDCPYCHKVMDFMDEHSISVEMRNVITDPANRERLLAVGGKGQVPCLFIDGEPLYESMDIIDFLAKECPVETANDGATIGAGIGGGETGGACSIDGECH
ncbi:MAG: glutathione S-transferase N-terminal domain-containing protein [Bifidobacterium tsurumiense]|uniref:glutaredoxin family protein n=1 Tax=Bifidobacterium tsurumiense TaxID=356829 RepID=UPI002A7ECBD2|nr:glutathione S-transferase N-terminal domain-containing protein [Bifidobacterium tsurumiense]MDY4678466.1 glutathione S-transferase N-terminal domain-containing protein [Bifidobacterium tsurumiense]